MDRVLLRRYWRRRGASAHAPDVFDETNDGPAGLLETSEALKGPCSVLLGPPGAGKTTALKSFKAAAHNVQMVSLGSAASEDRIWGKVRKVLERLDQDGGGSGTFILDSLDETSFATPQLAGFIEDLLDELPEHIRIVVACRSAAWLPGVESVLKSRYPKHLAVFDLAPLSVDDVIAYASSASVNGQNFLQAARAARVSPLAFSPNSLKFLLDEYLDGQGDTPGELSQSQRELFDRSCTRLLREPNPLRQTPAASYSETIMKISAGRAAVFSIFTGRKSFVLLGDARVDDLTREDLERPGDESTDHEILLAVLRSSLFTGVGEYRVGFAHQTLNEFLAAEYLASTNALSMPQIDGLFRGRGGLLAPQVQAVAAWLVALAPERYISLLRDDPASFVQSSVELVDQQYRRTLVEGLLDLASRHELLDPWSLPLDGLTFDGIEQRLGELLTNAGVDLAVRHLSVRIARATRLDGLTNVLLRICLNQGEELTLRRAAGASLLDLGNDEALAALTSLAQDGGPADDPDDELFGLGLMADLRRGTSPVILLTYLRTRPVSDLFGNYNSFITFDLPRAISHPDLNPVELVTALDWATSKEDPRVGEEAWEPLGGEADELLDAILVAGLVRLSEPGIIAATARLMAARCATQHQLVRGRKTVLPHLELGQRQSLLNALNGELHSAFDVVSIGREGMVSREDFTWAIEGAVRSSEADDRDRWKQWVRMTLDPEDSDHQAAVYRLIEDHGYTQDLVQFLSPRDLGDATSEEEADNDESSGARPTHTDLRSSLLASLSSEDDDAFKEFCYYAQFAIGDRVSHHQVTLRMEDLPGWSLLDANEQDRVFVLAQRYLERASPDVERFLGTDRFDIGARDGVRAIVLLSRAAHRISLPTHRWAFWAPAVVHGPFFNGDERENEEALKVVLMHASQAVLAAVESEIRGHLGAFTLERIAPSLGPDTVPWLVRVIRDESFDSNVARAAYRRLLELEADMATIVLNEAIATLAGGGERLAKLLPSALCELGTIAWTSSAPRLLTDHALAMRVVAALAHESDLGALSLDEEQVVELWEMTSRLFPANGDPEVHGAHMVSEREDVGHFRDRLLPELADRGTLAAVEALENLSARIPSAPMLRNLAARARAAQRRSAWSPLTPSEVGRLLQKAEKSAHVTNLYFAGAQGVQVGDNNSQTNTLAPESEL